MFEIKQTTRATLKTITTRAENHGPKEKAPALSLNLMIEAGNELLEVFGDPELRGVLFLDARGQELVPGVPEAATKVRSRAIARLEIQAGPYQGWRLEVEDGIGSPLIFGGCKVDGFFAVPKEGGSIELHFRIGTSDIDAHRSGALTMKLQTRIDFRLIAPEKIDEAPKKKPKRDPKKEPELPLTGSAGTSDSGATLANTTDATGVFVAQHGTAAPSAA